MRAIALVKMSVLTIGLGAIGLGAAPAGAMASSNASGEDGSRRVCKVVVPSGSRLGVRTCKSRDEWEREARQYQRDADQQRDNHFRVQPGASSGPSPN